MKIGLITTINTNIGDDFIRIGLQNVIRNIFPNKEISWVLLNKHRPQSVWPLWNPKRYGIANLPGTGIMSESRFHKCDIIIQCGAPVIWNNCSKCEWNEPIWQGIIREIHDKTPVLNLSIGSCFPLTSLPNAIRNNNDREYLQSILQYCRLTTARDKLAQDLCAEMGYATPLLPCSAGLAGPVANRNGNYIAVNYMSKAGHYDFENNIDELKWLNTFKKSITCISKNNKVIFLCHSNTELSQSKSLFPNFESVLPRSPNEYFHWASQCKFGLFNRLHASVAFAGMGIPSIAIGNDSRLFMVKEYGLPAFEVYSCTADSLIDSFENGIRDQPYERERLIEQRKTIFRSYKNLIASYLINEKPI